MKFGVYPLSQYDSSGNAVLKCEELIQQTRELQRNGFHSINQRLGKHHGTSNIYFPSVVGSDTARIEVGRAMINKHTAYYRWGLPILVH